MATLGDFSCTKNGDDDHYSCTRPSELPGSPVSMHYWLAEVGPDENGLQRGGVIDFYSGSGCIAHTDNNGGYLNGQTTPICYCSGTCGGLTRTCTAEGGSCTSNDNCCDGLYCSPDYDGSFGYNISRSINDAKDRVGTPKVKSDNIVSFRHILLKKKVCELQVQRYKIAG